MQGIRHTDPGSSCPVGSGSLNFTRAQLPFQGHSPNSALFDTVPSEMLLGPRGSSASYCRTNFGDVLFTRTPITATSLEIAHGPPLLRAYFSLLGLGAMFRRDGGCYIQEFEESLCGWAHRLKRAEHHERTNALFAELRVKCIHTAGLNGPSTCEG